MYRLFDFLRSTYVFLLFLIFEVIAISAYSKSDSYSQAKILSYSAAISGGIGDAVGSVGEYFRLRRGNEMLLRRIAQLEQELARYDRDQKDSLLALLSYDDGLGVRYQASRVVSNTINKQRNYLVLNSGLQDGIRGGMAVVTPDREMVGVVVECSDSHAVVMSILNTQFRSSGELEGGGEHAGSIYWDGVNRYMVKMDDLSKYADIKVGDKIVTTGFSQIFPPGVVIGTVDSFELDQEGQSYRVNIDIAARMSAIREVLVVDDRSNAEVIDILNTDLFLQ
ncbi:MAG: rod shape-determining protein MreC [Rikenellaceae bacterium]